MILEVNMNHPDTVMSKILLGRIILYGWVFSWLFLFAGLGTMEWAMETGEPVFFKGLLMFLVFVLFTLLAIHFQQEADKAFEEFEQWFDRTFGKE